mmetsp:Transcript_16085/g.33973  ORF Transcript_16085/g.33973 Transcript_16085/m.33973 type:complete len:882 (-) Transcript_16085:251-2896(-)|eukprot:CAMPEP_0183740016 /NCGR_PEP_ID=MMETSP0737-20130205/58669_1 /TAXON_ID=385413 /ORGANISM="Thalassiosira miniscula, Strain CCMP1093" /LENGTH=881 /DNA_ID=CAMNT_0025974991 /DNA_START=221 /DNA_END=2866 /DNA_ORIENTATION=+
MFSNSNTTPPMSNPLNQALNLFPTTSTPPATQNKLQKLIFQHANRAPTQIQSSLAYSLYDDALEYMNTLEMNRAASYTFGHRNSYGQHGTTGNALGGNTHGESIAEEMWELLIDFTLAKFTQHSVLALTKTISLLQHVLTFGSEACVMDGQLLYRIEMALQPLRQLNTALVEQQMVEQILNKNEGRASGLDNDIVLNVEGIAQQLAQFGTMATATMLKFKGGSVDRGHPVRVRASNLYAIVCNIQNLRQLRITESNKLLGKTGGTGGSLVPVGSTKEVGYITDEGRLRLLQEKMAQQEKVQQHKQLKEKQRLQQTRSNLAGRSATDSFGGGYVGAGAGGAAGGQRVVGAANSLQDMIDSAKFELEQHKSKKSQKIKTMKTGYTDNPNERARQLAELEAQNNWENDQEFLKKEKALKDALEYLEEMQREQMENVGDLLEGDLLGNDATSSGGAPDSSGGFNGGGAADLLGFDNNPPPPTTDVFGGASAAPSMSPMNNNNYGGAGAADLLGFDGLSGGNSDPAPAHEVMPGYMGGGNTNTNATKNMPNVMEPTNAFDMCPSLVTGMAMEGAKNSAQPSPSLAPDFATTSSSMTPKFTDNVDAMGAMGGAPGTSIAAEVDEEAEAEKSRKMQMAAGLFAGVVPNKVATPQKKPIMGSGSSHSNFSALDELVSMGDTTLAPPSTAPSTTASNSSVFDSSNDLTASATPSTTSDAFAMGPMGGIAPTPPVAPPSSSSDPFGMGGGPMGVGGPMGGGPLGGISDSIPAPSMAPPPLPTEAPPPPPAMAPPPPPMEPPAPPPNNMASSGMASNPMGSTMAMPNAAPANNTMMGANPSVEQMQEMIKQQQAQMAQMMQMMQQMQMQGGGSMNGANNGAGGGGGGWPPSS